LREPPAIEGISPALVFRPVLRARASDLTCSYGDFARGPRATHTKIELP
jgi:hypothetical protein